MTGPGGVPCARSIPSTCGTVISGSGMRSRTRSAALKRARRRNIPDKATAILAALRSPQLGRPPAVTAAYAVAVLNEQVETLQGQVEEIWSAPGR